MLISIGLSSQQSESCPEAVIMDASIVTIQLGRLIISAWRVLICENFCVSPANEFHNTR